jgi:two-component system chemotaxis response regulator CheY
MERHGEPGTQGRLVLVVDDEALLGEFIEDALGDEGYRTPTAPHGAAAHGAAALEVARRSVPDLILLDLRMPVMDGWEFGRRYRESAPPHAPVVVMSAAQDAPRWALAAIGAAVHRRASVAAPTRTCAGGA